MNRKRITLKFGRFSKALLLLADAWSHKERKKHLLLSAVLIGQLAQNRHFAANDGLKHCLNHVVHRGPCGIDGVLLTCLSAARPMNPNGFVDALSMLDILVGDLNLSIHKGMLIPFGDIGRIGLGSRLVGEKGNLRTGTFLLSFGSDLSRETIFSSAGLLSQSIGRSAFDFGSGMRAILAIPGYGGNPNEDHPRNPSDPSLYGITDTEKNITYFGLRIVGAITGALVGFGLGGPAGAVGGAGAGWGVGGEIADGVVQVAESTSTPPPAPEEEKGPPEEEKKDPPKDEDEKDPPKDEDEKDPPEEEKDPPSWLYSDPDAGTVTIIPDKFNDPKNTNTTPVRIEFITPNVMNVQIPVPLETPQMEEDQLDPSRWNPDKLDWNRTGGRPDLPNSPGNKP